MSLLALLLAVSTVSPIGVLAAESSSAVKVEMEIKDNLGTSNIEATEDEINTKGIQLVFTPNGRNWANDIDSKKGLVLSALGNLAIKLNLSTLNIDNVDRSTNKMVVRIPNTTQYNLSDNEIYSINFSPALIENWPGQVDSIDLKVYAKPQLTLGGSIQSKTTLENIQKGGKVIELKLVNAKWNQENLEHIEHYNKLLRSFAVNSNGSPTWDVAESLVNTDPNKVLTFSDDLRTLYMKLPPLSTALNQGDIFFKIINAEPTDESKNLYTVDTVSQGKIGGDQIENSIKTFNIDSQGTPILGVTSTILEKGIKEGNSPTLDLTLTNAKWATLTDEKKQLLIDSLIAKDQKDQWQLVKEKLAPSAVIGVSDTVVSIKLPQVADMLLKKDQIITAKVPYQLLVDDVNVPDQSFTIAAQPKALLSGSATPSISQTDFLKGGKTLVLTLVNTKWQDNIATNTTKRNDLLKSFNWVTDLENQVLARADVKRTNDSTVTIKLPTVNTKSTGEIIFTSEKLLKGATSDPQLLVVETDFLKYTDKFKIEGSSNQSASISGTIVNNTNNLDIAKGGKIVTITLKNDSWNKNVTTDTNITDFTNNNPIDLKISGTKINYKSLERKNDTTVTLTLDAKDLALTENSELKVEIPNTLVNISNDVIKDNSSIKIAAITAAVSGTGVSMEATDVQKGGKTIILTLNNAEFSDSNSVDFTSIFGAKKNSSPWNQVTNSDITASKNKLTIKLPAISGYQQTSTESLNLVVNSKLLKGYETIDKAISVNPSIVTIGATASGLISSSALTEATIKRGGNTFTITLRDAVWDPTIETNAGKKSALMKGFTVSDQTKEWGLVTTAIAKSGTFKIDANDKGKLTISLPSVPDYSIVRDQKVAVTIPKTVLNGYKYDIPTNQVLSITIPDLANETSFVDMLDSGLADFIEQNKIENIRVAVPKKNVEKFTTYVSELGKHKVATVNVYTSHAAAKVTATLISNEGEVTRTIERNVNNIFTLIFDDMKDDSTLHITVRNSSDEVIQEVFQKVAKGNKTYTIAPKTPLDGKYSLYSLLTEKSLLTNILKYYSLEDLKIGTTNN